MAPVYKALAAEPTLEVRLCITAQHRQMLDQSLDFFEIKADYDLNLMKPGQTLEGLSAAILTAMPAVLDALKPDLVLVHGDTTTSTMAALSAFYRQIPVGHVEAGLRTHDLAAPFPEEANRQMTSRLTRLHFAPTEASAANLLTEGVPAAQITITGNTVIDALFWSLEKVRAKQPAEAAEAAALLKPGVPLVLVTGHRRENFGQGFLDICRALRRIAEEGHVQVIYPVHLNPNVQGPVYELLSGVEGIHLIEPMPYEAFVWLMDKATLVITDSGGIQEEAPSLGKPVLVMRNTTERPEAVDAGTVLLVGTDPDRIASEALDLLANSERYQRMSHAHNPYGDGKAAGRIAGSGENLFNLELTLDNGQHARYRHCFLSIVNCSMSISMKITILNGPNLNLTGKRETHIYGDVPLEEIFRNMAEQFPQHQLDYFQSNHEGALIDKLHEVGFSEGGIILNAGALSHTSHALGDAIAAIDTPVIEVHMSNTAAREDWRHHSVISRSCIRHHRRLRFRKLPPSLAAFFTPIKKAPAKAGAWLTRH